MIARVISIRVKADSIEAFKAAAVANHVGSLTEPGIHRFDVLQNESRPDEFMLYEVYESEEATISHKETAHYKKWKADVEPMLAAPRGSTSFTVVAPAPDYS